MLVTLANAARIIMLTVESATASYIQLAEKKQRPAGF